MPTGVYDHTNRIKYKPGMRLGPYNILLLERTRKNKSGNWFGKFECPHCEEHNIFEANITQVVNGNTTSCGCIAKKIRQETGRKCLKYNLVGKNFGYLKVIKDTGKRTGNGRPIWLCQCCLDNNYVEYNTEQLQRGKISCGCIDSHNSNGEEKIELLLKGNNIDYLKEYSFLECKNPKTNRVLRFDFYLPDYNICIEYDGRQHFIEKGSWGELESLQEIQHRDNIKNQYCKDNNIKLIRIPYWDYNKIDKEYLMELIIND